MADSPVASSALTVVAGERKSMRHVAATAEGRLEFLEHQKYFAVVAAGLVFRLDIDGTHLAAVLPGSEVGACAVVRVIEAEARRLRREYNSPLAMRGNKRRAFFGGAVHVGRHLLAMPVQLFRRISFVVNVYSDLLAFLEAKQRPGELSIVGCHGDDSLGRDLDRRRLNVQHIIRGAALRWCLRLRNAGFPGEQERASAKPRSP